MKHPISLILLIALFASCSSPEHVDLILHNGHIYSMDNQHSVLEAMAVQDGKIVELGPEHHILNKYLGKNKVDLQKQFVFPGFNDAHCHFLGYGLALNRLDFVGTKSFEEVVSMISERVRVDTSLWVIGRGWDQNDWEDKAFPTNEILNTLFPDRYIVLKRVDGHAMIVSKNVLNVAGITSATQVSGGSIDFERGILLDEAMNLVEAIIPKPTPNDLKNAYLNAQRDCIRFGLTSLTDAGLTLSEVDALKEISLMGELHIKVNAMLSASKEIFQRLVDYTFENENIRVKSVKLYADGALGSRGAKLLTPYSDSPLEQGFIICEKDSVGAWAEKCAAGGFQLNVHCIGDSANRMVLHAMGSVLGGINDKRWRIEHAQVVESSDLKLFAEFNIIPSVQPTHATSDMYWAGERLGKDREMRGYRYKDLLEQNGLIALGTDFPVEDIDPLKTFYAAVTRQDTNVFPSGGYFPEQRLSRIDAMRGMTIWAAMASHEENKKGSLETGKAADFVVLNRDVLTCAETDILKSKVVQTWINGRLVFSE